MNKNHCIVSENEVNKYVRKSFLTMNKYKWSNNVNKEVKIQSHRRVKINIPKHLIKSSALVYSS